MDCGLPVALSVTVIDAARAPAAVGEKVALMEQAEPAARLPEPTGHVSPEIVKSPGLVPPNVTLLKVTGLFPLLVSVTLCAALVVPVLRKAKVRLAGLIPNVNVGTWPAPLSPMDCGLPVALSVREIEAVRAPLAVGEKVALIEQAEPAVKLDGHVLAEIEKSPGLVPPKTTLVKLTELLPVLVMITLCAALVVPVFCRAKVKLAGLMPSVNVGTCPAPVRPIDCGLPVALSVREIEAVRVPFALGVKVALMEQAAPAARLPAPTGQVSAEIAKSPGFVPPNATLLKVIGLFPEFVTVTLCAALVVPVLRRANVKLEGLKPSVNDGTWPVPLSPID
jgi:hypothetical protein